MKLKLTRKSLLIFLILIIIITISVPVCGAVSTHISTDFTQPSAFLYTSQTYKDNGEPMLAPYKEWDGDVVYCIGSSEQVVPPSGTQMSESELTDTAIAKMICAGYPNTESEYGLSDRDYHYVTQCAIRCHVMGRSPNSVVSEKTNFVKEMQRIYNAKNNSSNPALLNSSIAGSQNQTTATINGYSYYRFGPFSPSIINGELREDYKVALDNSNCFAAYASSPTSLTHTEWYSSSDKFYVFAPATSSGSVSINIEFATKSVIQNILINAYTTTNSNVQNVTRLKLDTYKDITPPTLMLRWSESGEIIPPVTEPPETEPPQTEPPIPGPPVEVTVVKKTTDGTHIEGVHFNFHNIDLNKRWAFITGEDGTATKTIPEGTYKITEVQNDANKGYILVTDLDGEWSIMEGANDYIVIENDVKRGNINVHKICEDGNQRGIANITFILSGVSDAGIEVEEYATTDSNGIATFNDIPVGTYTITEDGKTVPYGYMVADSQQVTVTYAETSTVEFYNECAKGSIEVHKTTEGMINLGGINFILSGVSDAGRKINISATTDSNGIATFNDIPVGTYTITEDGKTVPYGYMVADEKEVTVNYAETVIADILNEEMTGSIEIHKTTEGMINLGGINFILSGVSDAGRKINISATTDSNGIATFNDIPVGTYTITEDGKTVPYGYMVADEKEVTVNYAETVIADILNEEMTGSIEIHKTTEGMINLGGINFILSGVSDAGRKINISATTDSNGIATFNDIPVGTYTITEDGKTVPYGYMVADSQQVTVTYAETSTVEFYNECAKGSIEVHKTTEGMINLGGINFILSGVSDAGRKINISATTDSNGIATFNDIPVGTYTITEDGKTVPYGYMVADSQTVSAVYAKTEIKQIYNIEQKGSINLQKKTETMECISGIEMILLGTSDTGREVRFTAVTDINGIATFNDIPVGTYTITENGDTVPTGYLASTIKGVEVFNAKESDVELLNVPKNPIPKTSYRQWLYFALILIAICGGFFSFRKIRIK